MIYSNFIESIHSCSKFQSLIIRACKDSSAVSMIPVMFTSCFLKMFSSKTFSWTKFELHITKITLLCLTLPNQLSLVLMLSPILVSVGVLRPLDPVQHKLLVFLLLLGSPLHHHYIHILIQQNCTRHEQLGCVLLYFPLLGRIL